MDATGKGPIVYAAGKGLTSIVLLLLDSGLDVNAAYGHDLTALMWAAGHANIVPVQDGLATVKLLVKRGAELDRVDDRGRTALMIAAERGHAEIAAWLVENGADPTIEDRDGKTARDLAGSRAVAAALASASAQSPAR
jgi:ankyrin repeat protein